MVREDGWLEYKVIEKVSDPYRIHFYDNDPLVKFCTFFSTLANDVGFDLGPKSSSVSSSTTHEHLYSIPNIGDWWQFMQGYIVT